MHLDPIFAALAPGIGDIARTPGREHIERHRRAGLPALRTERRRPFRQDGAQRHRVRRDGRLRRRARHAARRPTSEAQARTVDAETAPLRNPEHYQYDFDLRDITELWRRGSVIASWLLDLTATSLRKDPELSEFSGQVSDSGEGRWTINAAIDEAVPVPVLSAALYQRFSSRGESQFADRVLSAMRYEFGGHREMASSGARTTAMSDARRCPRVLWRHRRSRLQEDLPGAARDGRSAATSTCRSSAWPKRAGRSTSSVPARARASSGMAAARSDRRSRHCVACCATSMATIATRRPFAPSRAARDGAAARVLSGHPPTLFPVVVDQLPERRLHRRRARDRRETLRPRPRVRAVAQPHAVRLLR